MSSSACRLARHRSCDSAAPSLAAFTRTASKPEYINGHHHRAIIVKRRSFVLFNHKRSCWYCHEMRNSNRHCSFRPSAASNEAPLMTEKRNLLSSSRNASKRGVMRARALTASARACGAAGACDNRVTDSRIVALLAGRRGIARGARRWSYHAGVGVASSSLVRPREEAARRRRGEPASARHRAHMRRGVPRLGIIWRRAHGALSSTSTCGIGGACHVSACPGHHIIRAAY